MTLKHQIGYNLKALREHKNLTQKQLSQITGYSRDYLSNVENHKANITVDNLEKIFKCLGVSLNLNLITQ